MALAVSASLVAPMAAEADPGDRHPLDPLGANFAPARRAADDDGPRQPRLPGSETEDEVGTATREVGREAPSTSDEALETEAADETPDGSVAQRIARTWPGDDDVAIRVARCESGLNPSAYNAAGPYYGLFQFDARTWRSIGGTGLPSQASVEEQTRRAWSLHSAKGWAPWPSCGGR